jgi:predicted DNA-binding transcriptional regulator AlpA
MRANDHNTKQRRVELHNFPKAHVQDLNAEAHRRAILNELAAAHWLGVSIATMRRMRWGKRGPAFVRLSPGRIGYRISDLEAWVESRTERAA